MSTQPNPTQLPGRLDAEERTADRIPVSLAASMFGERTEQATVLILDLTNLGCRVAAPQIVPVGSFVTIAIPAFTEVSAWVAWAKHGEVGLDFANPLHSRVVEYVIALATSRSAA